MPDITTGDDDGPWDQRGCGWWRSARHGWAREALAGRNTRAEVSGIAPATVNVRLRDGVQSVPALEVVVSTSAMHRRQAKRLRVRVFSLDGHTLRVHTCNAAK